MEQIENTNEKPEPVVEQTPKRDNSCGLIALIGCVVLFFGGGALAGAGYFGYNYFVKPEIERFEALENDPGFTDFSSELEDDFDDLDSDSAAEVDSDLLGHSFDVLPFSFNYPASWGASVEFLYESFGAELYEPSSDVYGILGIDSDAFFELPQKDAIALLRSKGLDQYVNAELSVTFAENEAVHIGGQNRQWSVYEYYERLVFSQGDLPFEGSPCDAYPPFVDAAGLALFDISGCDVFENELGTVVKLSGVAIDDGYASGIRSAEPHVVYLQQIPENSGDVDGLYFDVTVSEYPESEEQQLLDLLGTSGPDPSGDEVYTPLHQCSTGGGGLGILDVSTYEDRLVDDQFVDDFASYLASEISSYLPGLAASKKNLILDVAKKQLESYKGKTFSANEPGVESSFDDPLIDFYNRMTLTGGDSIISWQQLEDKNSEADLTMSDLQFGICQIDRNNLFERAQKDILQDRRGDIEVVENIVRNLKNE